MTDERRIAVGTAADGSRIELPAVQVLTGRGAILGKSGSGKSNTASVVIEELLESGFPVLVVDSDGEYYGLKEEYELLHAGADGECDIRVGPEHAEKIAGLALEQNVPIVLDVSGYLDEGVASELIRETARHLFAKEKKLKKPFLLVVEEVHEYVPEGGGMDETGRMLIKIGKRGRKHGLGVVGVSQRPADVKKDFLTQANWLVWHRLTWENDTKVVGRVVGDEYADAATDLDDGEAFVQRDWTDDEVARIQFDRKRTFDAGATPGLDDFERPELKSVSDSLVDDLHDITERRDRERDRIEELEAKLDEKDARIGELEAELRTARNVSNAARQLASALSDGIGERPFGFEGRLEGKNERIRELRAEVERLRGREEDAVGTHDGNGADSADGHAVESGGDEPEDGVTTVGDFARTGRGVNDDEVEAHVERLRRKGERLRAAENGDPGGPPSADLIDLVGSGPVVARIDGARHESLCNHEYTWTAIATLVAHGPLALGELAATVDTSRDAVASLLSELRARSLVIRDGDRRYALDRSELSRLAEETDERAAISELHTQW